MTINIDLNKNICKTFRKVVIDILNCNVQKVILKGGRNTTKSAVACISGLIFVMKYQCSALMIVEHSNKATERLSKNILKYMNILGIRDRFLYRKHPDKFILLDANGKPTIHEIDITGAMDPDDIKSMTTEDGGYSFVFLEEAGNFKSKHDIDNIFSTAMRGDTGQHMFVLAYNPPFSNNHHLNVEYGNCPCGIHLGYKSNYYYSTETIELEGEEPFEYKILVHHSTYLDVYKEHPEWLGGAAVLGEYELQRKSNKKAWEWDKLGKVVGSDAKVFWNIHQWKYEEDKNYSEICRGLDCSNGGPDPWAYTNVFYDSKNNDLYILDEWSGNGETKIETVAENIKRLNKYNMNFYIDSAVPTFRRLLNNCGLNALPAKKGRDSVIAGVIWLQSLNHIYIDPIRCPETFDEFEHYEFEIDKENNITDKLVDSRNHFIDACRYALCMKIKYLS